jgi:anti-sigma regulatory factor (Ser/Thr protein kinase)
MSPNFGLDRAPIDLRGLDGVMAGSEMQAQWEAADSLVLTVRPSPAMVGESRRAVARFCHDLGLDALSDDLQLLVSELMTNAYRHARHRITLHAIYDGDGVTVAVTDDNAGDHPVRIEVQDASSETGRGLQIVDALAGSWGITSRADGKSIWFRLP